MGTSWISRKGEILEKGGWPRKVGVWPLPPHPSSPFTNYETGTDYTHQAILRASLQGLSKVADNSNNKKRHGIRSNFIKYVQDEFSAVLITITYFFFIFSYLNAKSWLQEKNYNFKTQTRDWYIDQLIGLQLCSQT